jgi:ATP-dependent Lon protease
MLPWNVEDLVLDEERFNGVVRLFPLPDFILFPHVMQPLHIFEQRYRDLLNEALDSDGLISAAVLAPGWSDNYDGRPPVHSVACLGKIVAHHRLDDGRYNVMLLGSKRVRIVEELAPEQSFRKAIVELLHDVYPSSGDAERPKLQERLTHEFRTALPKEASPDDPTCQLLSTELPLGVLSDLAAFASPISAALKLQLLQECDVDRRAKSLIRALQDDASADPQQSPLRSPFPIRFSEN